MSFISKDYHDDILILTINRPKALNALNASVIDELGDLFMHNGLQDEKASGIIITGAGEKSFVAGADIKEFIGLDQSEAERLSSKGQKIFNAIEQFPKPVIAMVNGFALGGGLELAMACHLRTASENARFGLPEVSLGILPGYGGTQRLPQLIGKGRALEMVLTGKMIDAQQSFQYGLTNLVVSSEELLSSTIKMLNKIVSKGPLAISKSIQTILAGYDPRLNGMEEESNAFGYLSATQDFLEGVNAFIEKRTANFKGE